MQMQNGDRIGVKPIISTDLLDYNVNVREYGMDGHHGSLSPFGTVTTVSYRWPGQAGPGGYIPEIGC